MASRTMAYSGVLILAFVILHLITFRFGPFYPYITPTGGQIRDLHLLMTQVFSQTGYVVWYAVCLYVLGLHLSHAFWSSFQSLGWIPFAKEKEFRVLSQVFGWSVAIGFVINPLYIFMTRG
jgi:succinate dehydrogenase / fumarate reductase cytochrome b subunit